MNRFAELSSAAENYFLNRKPNFAEVTPALAGIPERKYASFLTKVLILQNVCL
jgi:hypothetical protein